MRTSAQNAQLGIYSYGRIATGSKPTVCYIIDVAGLRDPQANRGFRNTYRDGRAGQVQDYVAEDSRTAAIISQIKLLAHMHLRGEGADNKWLSFGLRDHHGKWTAPAVAELVTDALTRDGYAVHTFHYNIDDTKGAVL